MYVLCGGRRELTLGLEYFLGVNCDWDDPADLRLAGVAFAAGVS